jgi:serine/threonine protein kinase
VFDTFEDENFMYIIMELIKGVNLLKHLMSKQRSEGTVRGVMRSLVDGLGYLHSIGIAHRDIKFENIIVDAQSGVPKYIDFGLSKVFLVGEKSTERFGTLAYSSPEVLLGHFHDVKADVWSLGVVLHVLLTGVFPFLDDDKEMTKRNIVFERLTLNSPAWLKVSSSGRDLVCRMLEKREEHRLTI